MIYTLSLVALGGATGSVLRYLMVLAIGTPLATLIVNIAGSFLMGLLFVLIGTRHPHAPLLMVGVLGGFTTFSAFSLDTLKLWQGGQINLALAYVAASVLLSLCAVAIGASVAKGMAG